MICSFLSSVLYLHFSLFRIKFHHFSVSDRTITWCLGKFFQYFLRFLPLLLYVFVQNFQEFVQNRIFFVQKQEEVSVCFSGFFSLRRANFYVFSRPGKEIFLPVFIIFALLPGLSGRKIRIFRNGFSVRTNIFSLPRGVFPDFFFVSSDKEFYPSRGIFRSIRQEFSPFRLIFARTRRARTCTRVIIY